VTTRTVTGTFYNADGTPAAALTVTFRLSPNYYTASEHNLTNTVTGTTNGSGVVSVNLIVGARYVVSATNQKTFPIVVTAGVGAASLESLHASLDSGSPDIDTVQIAIQAALDEALADYAPAADLAALDDDLATETGARALADTTLQANISQEAATRGAADTALADGLSFEGTFRADADTALQDALTAEQVVRAAADALRPMVGQTFGPHWAPGAWHHANIAAATSVTGAMITGTIYFIPIYAARNATLDRVRFEVTVAGSADLVVRLGLYAYDLATGRPGALLATLGSVSNPGVGVHDVTINQALTVGGYYIGALATGTSSATFRVNAGQASPWLGSAVLTLNQLAAGLFINGPLAALPDPAGTIGGVTSPVLAIELRVGSLS
jgi:hypothetical protein